MQNITYSASVCKDREAAAHILPLKSRSPATSTHKKVIVVCSDRSTLHGYLNPSKLPAADPLDLLTVAGEQRPIPLKDVRAVYFVREFSENYEPGRKAFLSRPKLDGLWVRLKFRDNETIEGIVTNDLLSLLDSGIQITPPDFGAGALRIFVPRTALAEMTVLGVVGVARRKPAVLAPSQPKLFDA